MVAALLAYGIWHGIPDRRTARALTDGVDALERGSYGVAVREFDQALRLTPMSAMARQGLACSYYLTGRRSAAALELTKGLEAGVFAERLGNCEHGLNLDDVFFAAKLGLSDAFAVPRVAGAEPFEALLAAEPTDEVKDERDRMLLGACLALRAGLLGDAWVDGANALEAGTLERADRERFFECFGPPQRRQAGCADRPSIRGCVMTPAARSAYFRLNRLVDSPTRRIGS